MQAAPLRSKPPDVRSVWRLGGRPKEAGLPAAQIAGRCVARIDTVLAVTSGEEGRAGRDVERPAVTESAVRV